MDHSNVKIQKSVVQQPPATSVQDINFSSLQALQSNGGGIQMNQTDKQTITNKNLQKLLSAYNNQNSQNPPLVNQNENNSFKIPISLKPQINGNKSNQSRASGHQSNSQDSIRNGFKINGNNSQTGSRNHTNINSTASTSGMVTNFNATAVANYSGVIGTLGGGQGGMVVSDFNTSNQNSTVKQRSKDRIKKINSQMNTQEEGKNFHQSEENGNQISTSLFNLGSQQIDYESPLVDQQKANPFYTNLNIKQDQIHNNSTYEKTANFSSNLEMQQIHLMQSSKANASNDKINSSINNQDIVMHYPTGPMPASQIMSRRPKLNDNIKLIEKVIRRQNQTQQDSRQNIMLNNYNSNHHLPQSLAFSNQNIGLQAINGAGLSHNSLIPLINNNESVERIKYSQYNVKGGGSLNQSTNNVSKQQVSLKSPLLSINRRQINYDQQNGNSVQDHYISDRIEKTIQKYSKKEILKNNNSPFLNGNNGTAKSRNFNQSNSASKIYNSTIKGFQNNQKINQSPYTNNINIYSTNPNNRQISNQNDQNISLGNSQNDHKYDGGSMSDFNDLSFESLNPINHSYTEGSPNLDFVGINNKMITKGQVQIKANFIKGSGLRQNQILEPKNSNSYAFNPPDFPQVPIFDDSQQNVKVSQFVSNNPHVQWWSQQMFQQQNSNSIDEANALYQINSVGLQGQIQNQIYPQSVHVSPFQQSKSRDGGYRNIPMRDLSSISDQSPQKPFDQHDPQNPFKGPKLHLFKKGNSRRIKTSSATRNLQPINPLDNSKLSSNFSSINTGGIFTVQNNSSNQNPLINQGDPNINQLNQRKSSTKIVTSNDIDNIQIVLGNKSEEQYQTIQAKQYSSISQSNLNKNFSNDNQLNDIYQISNSILTDQSYGSYVHKNVSINQIRPNTTHIDVNGNSQSPIRNKLLAQQNQTNKQNDKSQLPSKISLQEEINGFKHSFYNERSTPKLNSQVQQSQEISQVQTTDSSRQIDKMKEQILQNSEQIKHIFVLNVANGNNNNLISQQQSTQESKAMTPCFIHTPNMTNKWGNFKPNDVKESANNTNYSTTSNQENVYVNIDNQNAQIKNQKDSNNLFKKDQKIHVVLNSKKPQTSHQSKNQSINMSQIKQSAESNNFYADNNQRNKDNNRLSIKGNSSNNIVSSNSSTHNNSIYDNIKLGPEDIYLVGTNSQNAYQSRNTNNSGSLTTNNIQQSQSNQALNNQSKPHSQNSYRRPISRNHPILKINSQQISMINSNNNLNNNLKQSRNQNKKESSSYSQESQRKNTQDYPIIENNNQDKNQNIILSQTSASKKEKQNQLQAMPFFTQQKSKSSQNVSSILDKGTSSLLIKQQPLNEEDNDF